MRYPLWMPKGSVRALLAFVIVIAAIVAVFVLGAELAAALLTLAGVVVERYFGSRGEAP